MIEGHQGEPLKRWMQGERSKAARCIHAGRSLSDDGCRQNALGKALQYGLSAGML